MNILPPLYGEGQAAKPPGWGAPGTENNANVDQPSERTAKIHDAQEAKLWIQLRLLRPRGYHFRRQAPFQGWYLDFVCFKHRLVIEVDDGQHVEGPQADRDVVRDAVLTRAGFHVMRVWNSDVNRNLQGVMDGIVYALESTPSTRR